MEALPSQHLGVVSRNLKDTLFSHFYSGTPVAYMDIWWIRKKNVPLSQGNEKSHTDMHPPQDFWSTFYFKENTYLFSCLTEACSWAHDLVSKAQARFRPPLANLYSVQNAQSSEMTALWLCVCVFLQCCFLRRWYSWSNSLLAFLIVMNLPSQESPFLLTQLF